MFTPLVLGDITLRNRVVVSPMCQYHSERDSGPNDYYLVHLGQLAMGGAGLFFAKKPPSKIASANRITAPASTTTGILRRIATLLISQ